MSKRVHFSSGKQISRRTILRSAGVAMAIPWLDAMNRAFAGGRPEGPPHRFVAMTLGLGLHAGNLFPEKAGRNYEATRYLKPLSDLRDQMTVISGSSHPEVKGGHRAEASILSAAPMGREAQSKTMVSVDQLMAKHLGHHTRFPSLVLSSTGSSSPSYTENGSMIPAEHSPARLFSQLFIEHTPEQKRRQAERARQGKSIMDLVASDAKSLARELGPGDKHRLDAYFTSVRELEKRMVESEQWALQPKPKVDYQKPIDVTNPNDFIGRQRLMSDMIRLALSTDSTRFISYHLGGSAGVIPLEGVNEAYHSLSHHGKDEDKLAQLAVVEEQIVATWGEFLRGLAETEDGGQNLLDHTSVLLTSNLGNASNHDNRNMPVLLAGGGFRHGQHLAFDQKNNYPLPNMYVSLLQNVGLEVDQFATSTGTMTGLS